MSFVAGIDYSSFAIDVVLLDENTDRAEHHRRRIDLGGPGDALTRIRRIPDVMPARGAWLDDIHLVAIEEPFSFGKGGAYTMQLELGAILACLPARIPLALLRADDWRSACHLPIRGAREQHKRNSIRFAAARWSDHPYPLDDNAADAFCIAFAGRELADQASKAA